MFNYKNIPYALFICVAVFLGYRMVLFGHTVIFGALGIQLVALSLLVRLQHKQQEHINTLHESLNSTEKELAAQKSYSIEKRASHALIVDSLTKSNSYATNAMDQYRQIILRLLSRRFNCHSGMETVRYENGEIDRAMVLIMDVPESLGAHNNQLVFVLSRKETEAFTWTSRPAPSLLPYRVTPANELANILTKAKLLVGQHHVNRKAV